MPRKEIPPKTCEWCGTTFERKMFGNRLEDVSVFRRRRFCSLTCANSRNGVTKGTLHWRARKLRGPKCEACGATASLHAHHIDQDPANNEPENIQTLCKQCHDFWHSTQKRRGWPIAGRMPALIYVVGIARVAHGVPHRLDRLAALGNALVPQIAEWIGRRIMTFEQAQS